MSKREKVTELREAIGPQRSRGRFLTVDQCLAEINEGIPTNLRISRRTWQEWQATGRGPIVTKLENGRVLVSRANWEAYLKSREVGSVA